MKSPETTNENKAEQSDFDTLTFSLVEKYGAFVKKEPNYVGGYWVRFVEGDAVTTIRIALQDRQTGADLVITNMTTLPASAQGKGLGSAAVQKLISWAKENNLTDIRAVQIIEDNEKFWSKNGFTKSDEPSPSNDFVYKY